MAIPTAARHAPTGKDGKRETGAAAITAKPVASAVTRRPEPDAAIAGATVSRADMTAGTGAVTGTAMAAIRAGMMTTATSATGTIAGTVAMPAVIAMDVIPAGIMTAATGGHLD